MALSIDMFERLSSREKDMVTGAVVVILVALIVRFIFFPSIDERADLSAGIKGRLENLQEITLLSERYKKITDSLVSGREEVKRRDGNFTLFSFVDSQAEKSGVKSNVAYMKPSSRKSENGGLTFANVRIKLDGVVIRQIEEFVYNIESSANMVHVRSLSLAASGDEKRLSAIVEIETIMADSGGTR